MAIAALLAAPCASPQSSRVTDREIDRKVEVLLTQMTVEEKIGQLTQSFHFVKNARSDQRVVNGEIGAYVWETDPAEINRLQHLAIEESRLHIPLIFMMDVIHGYGGTSALALAMQRGEIQASCAFQLSALKSAFRMSYEAGDLIPIVQFARKSPELAGVPHVLDFARTEEERQVFNLVYNRDIMGRALAAPPGIPVARTALLRRAFDAAVVDPELTTAAARAGLPLTPMHGEEVEAFVRTMMAVPPEVAAKARAALEFGQQENLQLKSVAGTISEIGGGRIKVKDAGGKPLDLSISDADSTIMLDGRQAALSALNAGMACFLRYTDADVAQVVVCK